MCRSDTRQVDGREDLSEIHRLAGEWLAARRPASPSDVEQAAQRLRLAVAIAHGQGARAFEQRAAASLALVTNR